MVGLGPAPGKPPPLSERERRDAIRAAGTTNAALGLVAAVAALVLADVPLAAFASVGVAGLLVATIGAARALRADEGPSLATRVLAVLNMLLGAWIAAAPFLLQESGLLAATSLVLGVAILLVAAAGAWSATAPGRAARRELRG